MEEKDRKLLTEYLGLCWHERSSVLGKCIHCGRVCNRVTSMDPRTFTTMPDLIALYEAIHGADEFDKFLIYSISVEHQVDWDYIPWLFCLNAPDQIPERCKMVAEWVRERGK